MERIYNISDDIKRELLDFLYQDEVMNLFLIHYIENQPEALSELYVSKNEGKISEVVHIKNDGNSYFTSFYCSSVEGLNNISKLIKNIHYEDILLAGKAEEVECIQKNLKIDKKIYLNNYYMFDVNKDINIDGNGLYIFRRATTLSKDIEKLKKFLVGFFEAEKKEDIEKITSDKKINEEMKNGVYFLEIENEIVGMARYFGQSNRYIDITTLYIDEQYRNRGYGSLFMRLMVKEAFRNNKIPITQTALSNIAARRIYEDMGFIKICDYTFQLI